jgi:vacuolar protein sorting-associated protein 53
MLVDILDKAGESVDVAALMKLLQRTIDFERQMTSLLAHQTTHEESSLSLDPKSPASIRQKYLKEKKKSGKKDDQGDTVLARQTSYKYNGLVSSCFEAYMSAYVEFEDRNLGDVVATALYHEVWAAEPGSTARILTCSSDIFLAIKKSLDRCLAVTKGETLHDLTVVFKTHLFSLVDGFKERIPKPQPAPTPKDMASRLQALRDLGSSDSEKREEVHMSDDDIRRVTYIINTSEYVFETLEQLHMLVRNKIDEHLQRRVDFVDVQDAFSEVITNAIRMLVMTIETRCEHALVAMQKTNWMNVTEVGDQSPYVEAIDEGIQSVVNVCAPIMSLSYYRFFCDKLLSSWFVPRFIAGVLKIKKIGDQAGAQQLLFDTQILKIAISRTPSKHPELDQPHPGFVRMLNRDMGKAEGMVKVILSPVDTIVSSYRALVGGKSSDFFRLLEMKNIKKSEANVLVEKYEALVKREKEAEANTTSTMY